MTKHNARFMNETGYAFNRNKRESQRKSSGHRNNRNTYVSVQFYLKHIRFAVTCSIPGYKESSCTSIFTEEFLLAGHFRPSISGIVTTPVVGSRATARFDAVDVISRCRPRLRESRLAPDS